MQKDNQEHSLFRFYYKGGKEIEYQLERPNPENRPNKPNKAYYSENW